MSPSYEQTAVYMGTCRYSTTRIQKENTGQRACLVGTLAFAALHGMSGTQVTRKIIERVHH
jgi:hypothetical protein